MLQIATYHCSVKVLKRSNGQSAIAAAAYRSGTRIKCEREGRVHDYTKKQHVYAVFIVAPEAAPGWVQDRSALWNRAELAEKRQDAQVAREVEVALPREIPKGTEMLLVRNFIKKNFTDRGMIADVAIHRTIASDGQEQPHAHIMLTMRPLDGDDFSKKKDRSWNQKQLLEDWRRSWAESVNHAYKMFDIEEQVDHRSYERQGLDIAPTVHLGPAAHAMEKRGLQTERGDINRIIHRLNEAYHSARIQVEQLTRSLRAKLGRGAKITAELSEVSDGELNAVLKQRRLLKEAEAEKKSQAVIEAADKKKIQAKKKEKGSSRGGGEER